jgi:hypothetical protein
VPDRKFERIMTHEITAKWILDKDRPDLMANWFNERKAEVHRLREKVETSVWGGLADGAKQPHEVHREIGELRQKACYLYALTSHAGETDFEEWNAKSDVFRSVTIAAKDANKSMSVDVNEIARLHTLVGTFISRAEALCSGPI